RSALEAVARHEVVEHVRAHDAEVGHRAALGPRPLDEGAGDLGGGETDVPAHRDVAGAKVVDEGAAGLARHLDGVVRRVEDAHVTTATTTASGPTSAPAATSQRGPA